MPLLYGEGTKALVRLQEEIMRKSNDHALFMWTSRFQAFNEVVVSDGTCKPPPDLDWAMAKDGLDTSGLLAPSPDVFRMGYNVPHRDIVTSASPYQMTNEGLEMRLPLRRINEHVRLARLKTGYGVYLYRLTLQGNVYVRIMCDRLLKMTAHDPTNEATELIYIAKMPCPRFKLPFTERPISRLALLPSAGTAQFKVLRVAREEPDKPSISLALTDWDDMPWFALADESPWLYWLVLQDLNGNLYAVIITNLPGWNFPMLGALPLRFAPCQSFNSTVQLEPAGVDLVMGEYTVSTEHASSSDGEGRAQDLHLIIERTRQHTCGKDPSRKSRKRPGGIASKKADPRHAGDYHKVDGQSRIDALVCFTST